MKRYFASEGEILFGPGEVVCEIEQPEVGAWALEMTLLLMSLSDSVSIGASQGRTIVLSILPEDKHKRTRVAKASPTP